MRRIKIMVLILTLCTVFVACQKGEHENISLEQVEEEAMDKNAEDSSERTEDTEYIFV